MDPHLKKYADHRATRGAAVSYSTKYERYWHKRVSDRRERTVIARAVALAAVPHLRVLDMPCGAGRLTREVAGRSSVVFVCDYSPEQLRLCVEEVSSLGPRPVRASCFHLPFADRFFDLVFSARLSHHIAEPRDRERYLAELFRVARGSVIVSVFDARSIKNRVRELRRRFYLAKRGKFTMRLERVTELAAKRGFRMVAALPISRLFSGHRYCVFVRGNNADS